MNFHKIPCFDFYCFSVVDNLLLNVFEYLRILENCDCWKAGSCHRCEDGAVEYLFSFFKGVSRSSSSFNGFPKFIEILNSFLNASTQFYSFLLQLFVFLNFLAFDLSLVSSCSYLLKNHGCFCLIEIVKLYSFCSKYSFHPFDFHLNLFYFQIDQLTPLSFIRSL